MLGPTTTRYFYRTLYSGMLRTVILNHRGPNQQQSTGQSFIIRNTRQKKFYRGGQNLDGTLTSQNFCIWQFARVDLKAAGVPDIFIVDRITDTKTNELWQPESDDIIIQQLYDNFINCPTKRIPG